MNLRHFTASFPVLRVEGSLSAEVAGIAYEARRVSPGDVYFALQRRGFDGHTEIELAIGRGAAAIVCERSRCLKQRATVIEVADPRAALGQAAAAFFGHAGEKLRVLGVSGRGNGWKTAYVLRATLELSGINAGLISSLRNEVGERRLPSSPQPEGSDIQQLFAEMARAGCTTCVLEIPEVSVPALRSIPLDLLVLGGGDRQYWWNVIDYLNHGPSRRPACGIISTESAVGREAACGVLFDALATFGRSSAAQVSAQDVRFSTDGIEGTLYIGNDSFPFKSELAGPENLDCLLAACAAAFSLDVPAGAIARAIPEIRAIPGSLEKVPHEHEFDVFVDEARDEQSLEQVLRSLRRLASGRVLLAFGASERTPGRQRFDLGQIAAKYTDYVVLTSDNPGRESVDQICSAIAQGLERAGHTHYHFQPKRAEAIAELIALAQPGDVLLIAGKGERTYQEFASTIVPFDDRMVAADCLAAIVPARPRVPMRTLVAA